MTMEKFDPRVDAYIAKSADFAQPILEYIREIVHEASPLLTESIKWGFPFFEYKGPICHMSSFKQYSALGFWKAALLSDPNKVLKFGDAKAGSLGEIRTIEDLPAKQILVDFVIQAIALNEHEVKVIPKKAPTEKKELIVPDYFIQFLAEDPKAVENFYNFSNSHKKEYVEWLNEAKSDETRQKRLATALEWISEGKSRNWKYQK